MDSRLSDYAGQSIGSPQMTYWEVGLALGLVVNRDEHSC